MHSIATNLSSSAGVNDVSMLVKQNQNCQATNMSAGKPCGEGLRILDDFRKLYESRIEKIEKEPGGESDRVSVSSVYYYCGSCDSYRFPILAFLCYFKCL